MTTGLVMVGKGETGVIVCGPGLGILKAIVSEPAAALAAVIASRRVHSVASQIPLPGSAEELTVKVSPAIGSGATGSGRANAAKAGSVERPESRSPPLITTPGCIECE